LLSFFFLIDPSTVPVEGKVWDDRPGQRRINLIWIHVTPTRCFANAVFQPRRLKQRKYIQATPVVVSLPNFRMFRLCRIFGMWKCF